MWKRLRFVWFWRHCTMLKRMGYRRLHQLALREWRPMMDDNLKIEKKKKKTETLKTPTQEIRITVPRKKKGEWQVFFLLLCFFFFGGGVNGITKLKVWDLQLVWVYWKVGKYDMNESFNLNSNMIVFQHDMTRYIIWVNSDCVKRIQT